jgi:hypothetical protein
MGKVDYMAAAGLWLGEKMFRHPKAVMFGAVALIAWGVLTTVVRA